MSVTGSSRARMASEPQTAGTTGTVPMKSRGVIPIHRERHVIHHERLSHEVRIRPNRRSQKLSLSSSTG